MSDNADQQIEELQMRVAFQEDTLQTMSEQMAMFTMELQLARKQIQLLSDKIINISGNSLDTENSMPIDERPPHY